MPFNVYEADSEGDGRLPSERPNGNSEHPRTVGSRRKRDEVLLLWKRDKAVPLAIADKARLSVATVARILTEEGVELPSYLTTTGRREKPPSCPHCGKPV